MFLFGLVSCASAGTTQSSSTAPTANANRPQEIDVADHATISRSGKAAIQDSLRAVLGRAMRDSAFPGAYAAIGNHSGVLAELAVGQLDRTIPTVPDAHTLWDLASLTKVVGMTSAMMQLVEQHRVELDAPAQRYLPRWKAAGAERVTVRHLLSHSAGLPAWRPLYKESHSPEEALALVYATAPDTLPGIRYVYSDLGAILLGQIVESVSGESLDGYLAKHVFAPLGMTDIRYRPGADVMDRVAPTEIDSWRGRQLRGDVHDENAYSLGGVAGHAGLFGSGADLARLARMYLNGGALDGFRLVTPATIALFTQQQDKSVSHRALGWETSNGTNSGGHLLSARAFGHTGFTGTSIWIDPGRDLFIILLTNRVNPSRVNTKIGGVRVALADAVVRALDPGAVPISR